MMNTLNFLLAGLFFLAVKARKPSPIIISNSTITLEKLAKSLTTVPKFLTADNLLMENMTPIHPDFIECNCRAFLHEEGIKPGISDYNYKYQSEFKTCNYTTCKELCVVQPSLIKRLARRAKFCLENEKTGMEMVICSKKIIGPKIYIDFDLLSIYYQPVGTQTWFYTDASFKISNCCEDMWPGQCFRKTLAHIVNNFKLTEKTLQKKARILEKSSVMPVERIMEKIHGKAVTKKKELQEKIKNYLDKVGKKNKSDIDMEELESFKGAKNMTRNSENLIDNEETVARSFEDKSNRTNVRRLHDNGIEVLKDTIKKLTKLLMDHRKSEYIVTQEITKKLQQLKDLNRDSGEKNVDVEENVDFLMSDHTRIVPRIEPFTIQPSLSKKEMVTEKYGSLEDEYYTTTFADYKLDNNEGTVAEIELNDDTFEDQIKRFKSTNWEETNQENNFDK